MQSRILIVDDEIDFLESLERGLSLVGFRNVRTFNDPKNAADIFYRKEPVDIALLDISMPGMSGVELLDIIKSNSPTTECVMITALDEARLAVTCLQKGAFDYRIKPIELDDLVDVIYKALEKKNLLAIHYLGKQKTLPVLNHPDAFSAIITRSPMMQRLMKEAELHAESDVPILITGETGTGKELLAQAIHLASSRAKKPFTPINMSALSPTLFEAEFYGHTKGAFTGAGQERKGYLEETAGGTLFLDEIGSLPLEFQGKLLRVLQERQYYKLGSSRSRYVDVRFIAATNVDLEKLQQEDGFRKDLFYRLCGAWLVLPPLRERMDDLSLLIERFLLDAGSATRIQDIDSTVWDILRAYSFPGNIRELRSIVFHAANLSRGGRITVHHLPGYLLAGVSQTDIPGGRKPFSQTVLPLAEVEKRHILDVYHQTGKNKLQTAHLLDVGLNTLRRKLKLYGVD